VSVGRLDFNTEGLLLLTNDGELARYMELPKSAWPRQYKVNVKGQIDPQRMASVADGAIISGMRYEPVKIEFERGKEADGSTWLSVTITKARTARCATSWHMSA
jgi:23S rRNA pseudouridine2605 synthase